MYFAVYITAKNAKEAKNISGVLLKKRLIACANIISNADSLYWRKNRVRKQKEAIIICKTRGDLQKKIVTAVKKHHSYETPCISFLPVTDGNADYLKWISSETKKA